MKNPKITNTQWTLIFFSLLLTCQLQAAKPPAAYAGLDQSAYHLLELSMNKSSQLGFVIEGIRVDLPLATKSTQQSSTYIHHQLDAGHIAATKGNNSLFGQMHLNNKHYILTTDETGIWAVELPKSGMSYNDCGVDHSNLPKSEPLDLSALNKNTNKAAGTIIDVLMIYDQAIADRYPGDLLQTRVDQYFNLSNQTYANSGIDLAIRQVGLEQVGYDFNDANINARNAIQQSLNVGVGARGFENVPQLRDETGADLVIFLRTHNIETRGNCGIAFFPVGNNNNLDDSYGVNIMADGMSSWSICTDQLMVHEIGHNLSAGHHNWSPTEFGYPADAKGFAKLGQYGTVMGSFGTGTPDRFLELNYFSNPSIQCGGGPCGIPGEADNANVINQLKGPVADYRDSTSSAPLPADFTLALTDIDNDGVLDRDDEFPHDATETVDSDGDGVGNNADAFPNDNAESVDFDGDGIGNNDDNDDDNDGILDFEDAFPQNPNEVKDTDGDGVGDIADDFVFDVFENADSDQDGTGNNTDSDDDNDGVIDINNNAQDLLVISVGNNRMLRFDAQTGLAKGIEVLPREGVFTFQSDLSFHEQKNVVFFSHSSSIKSIDNMDLYSSPKLLLPPYSNSKPSVGSGFPTAIQANGDQGFIVSILDVNVLKHYSYENRTIADGFEQYFFSGDPDFDNNFIDMEVKNNRLYTLGQNINIQSIDLDSNENYMNVLGGGTLTWFTDPYAMVVTDDNRLLHSDQGRNKVVATDLSTESFDGIFADLEVLGYSNPTGIDITNDGRLLVAAADQNAILQFDLDTEEFLGELVNGFGLDQPHKMVLVPQLADRFHQDADKVMRPNAGNWFNPDASGRGINIGIFNNRLQVLWFTYDEQGQPIWYTSAGLLEGFDYSAELLKTRLSSDGEFSFEVVGQLDLTFANEREAQLTWQLGELSGTEPISWLQASGEPDIADYTGMWSRPDTPGWGVAVSTNGDVSFAIPFIYDDAGEPRWSISDVFRGTSPLVFNMDTVFSEGLCPSCSGPIETTRVPSGTTTLILDGDDSSWSSDFLWADPIPGNWQLDGTEIIRISSLPTRPR